MVQLYIDKFLVQGSVSTAIVEKYQENVACCSSTKQGYTIRGLQCN